MIKKNVVLVFGITENYTFALANTLMGLVDNNKKFWDDIIVYCDSMSEENKKNINKIVKCIFVDASEFSFKKNISQEVLDKYSIASFYRYECFNLLKKYKTVIWNDVDILIQGDISNLVNYGNNGIALTKNIGNFKVEANFTKLILKYDMFVQLYNSGIMVLKDSFPNYESICDWCVKKTMEYASILRWPDQGIINILIQEFDITPDLIDIDMYCCHPTASGNTNDAKIIHAYGDDKFWNSSFLIKKFPKWAEYNDRWEKISNDNIHPLVSCVMSTYNRYDYLLDSVNSILNQTYHNIELIIVTEKCDNQEKICKILNNLNDKRIKVVNNKEKLGFAESLNIGIQLAKGKYIARMDDDDISLPERFEKQVSYLEKNPNIGICGTNAKFFGKSNDIIGVESDSDILKIITLYRTPFIHPTVMMRKELIDKYNLKYNSNYFTEDYELWSRAVYCFPVTNLKEVLLLYRTGDNQLTGGNNEIKIHNSHKKIMKNQLENYLHLQPNENEIELLQGRFNVLENCYNYSEALKIKNNFIHKIIDSNQIYKVYNSQKLSEIFKFEVIQKKSYKYNIKSKLKALIKKMLYPVYSRLMLRVDRKIENSEYKTMNYCDEKIKQVNIELWNLKNEKK